MSYWSFEWLLVDLGISISKHITCIHNERGEVQAMDVRLNCSDKTVLACCVTLTSSVTIIIKFIIFIIYKTQKSVQFEQHSMKSDKNDKIKV